MHSLLRSAFEQWGKGKTFSIPFPAQCLHVVATYASTKSSDDNSDITVTATSTTGYITHKTYETFFLALGHQPQWGINIGGAVQTSTLPITFTNVFLAVASTSTEWCCPGCSATNTTVTTRAYQSNRPDVAQPNDVNWIVIGCQPQWGANLHGWVIFPIPFSQFRRLVTNHQGKVFMDSKAVESNSLSGFTLDVRNNNDSSEDAQWIAIGC